MPNVSSTHSWARSNTDTTLAVMAEASFPMMMLWWTLNHPISQRMVSAMMTDRIDAEALLSLSRSKNRANGYSEIEIKMENNKGIRTPCVATMNARISAAAKRLEAKLRE